MFNRNRNQSGQQAAIAAFDDVLAELGSRGTAETEDEEAAAAEERETPDATDDAAGSTADDQGEDAAPSAEAAAPAPASISAADRIQEHADTLRATRDAQQRAQEMLALAATARSEATDQAEQLLLEAKDAAERVRADADDEAERTRKEAVAWVTEQRTRVETAASQLTREAERDAENIRTEAMRSAMVEAEQTARLYVGEAAARGARDAEEIRGKAREVLHRAADLGSDLKSTMADLVAALEVATEAVTDQLHAIDALLDEARRETDPVRSGDRDDAPPADATAGAVDEDQNDGQSEDETADDEPSTPPAEGRQLGSLFRDQSS